MKVNIVGEALGIEEYMEKDRYTYYTIDEKDKRTIKFDNIYTKWMRALYSLVCYIVRERDKRYINISKMGYNPKYHFFWIS